MKKIAIIKTYPTDSDFNYYNSQEIGLANSISKSNFEVHIYSPSNIKKISKKSYAGNHNIKLIELPFYLIPLISQVFFYNLFSELRKHHYDLIHINEQNEFSTFLTSIYAKKNNIPFVIYQGIYQADTSRLKRIYQYFYDRTCSKTINNNLNIALTKTSRAKNYLHTKGLKKIEVLPVGLDTSCFENSKHTNWAKVLDIPINTKILLYVGSLEKRRNIEFLIKLSKSLEDENFYLLIAGDGPEKILLMSEVTSQNIKYLGKVKQNTLKSLYEYSDLFLLASDYEIYGMVVLESLYFGCPVISTNTAGPEDIINNENGHIIDNLDIKEWGRVIKNSYNKFNRELISNNLTEKLIWPVIAKKYLQLTKLKDDD